MVFSENYIIIIPHFLLFFFLAFISRSRSAEICPETTCPSSGIPVKFPFRLSHYGAVRCGYPGFELSCNHRSDPIVSLPSGDFAVRSIYYERQTFWIDDPETFCLPKRLLQRNFSVSGTSFKVGNLVHFTFLNCSSDAATTTRAKLMPISCMSGNNFTVAAIPAEIFTVPPPMCSVISTVLFPVEEWWLDDWGIYLNANIELSWDEPRCGVCEQRGGDCGFKRESGLQIECFNLGNHSLPTISQYAILTTAAILGILCFIRLRYIRRIGASGGQNNNDLASALSDTNQHSITGLEDPIIESYPKTLVGESGRLPKANDNICPICLSEYRPKETLRTIPECNHYFHSDCIDEWLRVNATCPLCRNLPGTLFSQL
ncbi:RING-H2 finger protein ATL20 [Ziziphus jujuba]|uniref:RING-type E3 ubiquitin transferase n=1 Tax=Ziziphus jujuba TaxID=326968 RepID=A0A6P4AGV2_ZIZJJ|nr:RING-H2 finger protein ATL20 [Ziziphus jujuba]